VQSLAVERNRPAAAAAVQNLAVVAGIHLAVVALAAGIHLAELVAVALADSVNGYSLA